MIRNGVPVFTKVLSIPEQRVGKYSITHIEHPAHHIFELYSSRTAMFGEHRKYGRRFGHVQYDTPTRWHQLNEGTNIWMTDYPIEQYQHDHVLSTFKGSVLVGGLGLGYAVTFLAYKRNVTKIVVVEKSKEVVQMVAPYLLHRNPAGRKKVEFVTEDLFTYLKTTKKHFNVGFYDIWAQDGENTFFQTVCPLRALSFKKVDAVACWNEDVMRGQLLMALHGRVAFSSQDPATFNKLCDTDDKSIWIQWCQRFLRWYRDVRPNTAITNQAIALYVQIYGKFPNWFEIWQELIERRLADD